MFDNKSNMDFDRSNVIAVFCSYENLVCIIFLYATSFPLYNGLRIFEGDLSPVEDMLRKIVRLFKNNQHCHVIQVQKL